MRTSKAFSGASFASMDDGHGVEARGSNFDAMLPEHKGETDT